MTILRDTLRDILIADTALMGYLSGGLHTGLEISRQNTPSAFNADGELRPCALLKMELESPIPPHWYSTRAMFSVMLYQRFGYSIIEYARERVYVLLHRQRFGSGMWEIHHTDDVNDTRDDAIDASLIICRFECIREKGL